MLNCFSALSYDAVLPIARQALHNKELFSEKKISLRDAYEDGGSVPKKFVIKYYEYCHKLP